MFKVSVKERIDYISYGKLTRYTLCHLPNCAVIARISPFIINGMIVFSALFQMSVCVWKANTIFAYLLKVLYKFDSTDSWAVIVVSLPYFLATITIHRLPWLTVTSIVAFASLGVQMILELIYCWHDIGDKVVDLSNVQLENVPELVSCLLMATGSFPVVSIFLIFQFKDL